MSWAFFVEPSNLIFSISLSLMFLLGLLECILMIIGSTSQGFLDQFIPDQLHDIQKPDLDLDGHPAIFAQFLDWLYLGRVPMLIWLIVFLTVYALFGFIFQIIFNSFTTYYLSIWFVAPVCLVLSMPIVRLSAAVISRVIPKDESTAIYSEELIGRIAQIILGEAKPNYPAQAKVKDQFGQIHYVMVEPETETIFTSGQEVILTQKTTIGFKATSASI